MAQKSAGVARWFADAFRQHQAGQWREAEAGYRRVLGAQPRHADCLYLLGSLLAQQGQFEHALAPLAQAAALHPHWAETHNNLGIALKEMGRTDEAIAAYDHALQARPDYAEAANNKAVALQSQGRLDEAVSCFAQAVAARPAYAEAWNNQGIALNALARHTEAAQCFAQAIALEPHSAHAHNNLGNAQMAQSQFNEALAAYDHALAIDDASAEVHSNKGTALKELSRFDEARAALARALQIQPAYPDALSNLATCLLAEGRTADALEAYSIALALDPGHVDAHWNRALALLIAGDWVEGWAEYEWRFRKFAPPCASDAPRWEGGRLDGKTILVCAEQGAGDTLKFVRYLPWVQAQGARVVFACPPALRTLMASCAGIDTIIALTETVPHDVWVPLLSLPGLFGTTPETVPQNVPYLSAPLELTNTWQAKVGSAAPNTIKIGLCWAGSADQKNDHNRSARLADFAPLARVPGITFFSLQKGDSAAQAADPPPGMTLVNLTHDIHDFADTAALMAHLDLIVTVDTSVAHLAGALGVPVWTVLPQAAPWHYLHGRADSPWYPTMRLFQQTAPRNWASVFAQAAQTLLAAVAAPLCAGLIADGEAAYAQNNLAQAHACFTQALEIDPAQARALNNLAVLDYADGRYEAALAWLERALAVDPADDAALANKLLCLEALGRNAHAAHSYPRVSVIVPCYKQAHLLPEAVQSVVAQTYAHWELIIVNDGSPDNTSAVAQALIARYPHCAIRLVERPNGGLSAARNTGIKAARGQYILPLDADDKLHPEMLEKTVALLESSPEAAICYTDVRMFGTQDKVWLCGPLTLEHSRLENTVAHCCLFRREVFAAVGGYSTRPGYEDWEFWLDALDRGFLAVYLPEPLFLYRQWAQSKGTGDSKKRARFVAEIVLRHAHLYHPSRLDEARQTLALPADAPQEPALAALGDAQPSDKQRVLLAMNWFFPHVGGEEKLSEDIGAALVEAGFEVEIATRALADRTQDTHRGMRIHSLTGNVGDEFQALVAARRPYAVVIIGGPEIEFLPAAAQLPEGGPRVVIVPCIKPDSYTDVHAVPALRRALEAAAQRAEVVVTSSRYGYDARLFADLGIDSVYVPNAVNRTEAEGDFRARYGVPKEKRLLVDVSNMRREKNHAGLLHHLRDLPGDWHLVLIGCRFEPTPHVAAHIELLAAHDPRVTIVPGATPALIAAALEEADLLLLPSLADATPLVLLEAMSHGLPWIATPECGSAHDHAGGLMLPLPRFGPAIDFLLSNEPARAALAQAGHAHWQACYTYDVIGPRYAALVSGAADLPDLQAPADALAQTEAVRALFDAQPVPTPAAKADLAVSVVIVTQQPSSPLGKILDAYAAQTLAAPFFEVIIVDARPAGSAALAINSTHYLFALTALRQDTARGEAFARNAALLRARGEIVLLMTDTLLPAPDYLEQHLRAHQKYSAPQVGVLGRIADSADTARSVTRFILSHTDGLEMNFDAFRHEDSADARAFATHGVSAKRAFLLGRGLYSETAGAQMHAELGWRLKDDGLHFCYCSHAVARSAEPISFADYCARQEALGRAAAHVAAREADPYLLFWLGVYNAEDRLDTLKISAHSAGQVGAQLAALDKAGLSVVQARADFLPTLVPALGRLCRLEAERLLLNAYLSERDALIVRSNAPLASAKDGAKVSVVIPCYKYAHYLTGAIESLAAQTYTNWEAVIVDDGSPDNTIAVAQSLIDAHPGHAIRLISQPNTGHPSFARNRGIRETDGGYILCMDADDEIAPTFLAECVGLLEHETGLSIAYTDQWRFTDDGQGTVFHCGDWHPADLSQYLPLGVCTLFRRQAWTDAGGWRAVGYEDWDFWMACAEAGHRGLRIPLPLYRYRKHDIGKYEADRSRGFVNKAWLALNHPALHDDNRLRWAWGVVDTDRFLDAPHASAQPNARVSVVLTAMGVDKRELERAVQSIRAQTHPHVEIVVAGPGAASIPPGKDIIIAEAAHGSHSADAARAHALDLATGKYVAYLDSGTRWTPEHLATLVGFLEDTRYRAAYAEARTPGEAAPAAGFDAMQILVQNTVPLCGLVHARACLARTGSFDLSLPALADWEFVIRLSRFFDLAHLRTASVLPAAQFHAPTPVAQAQATRLIYNRYRTLTETIPVLRAAQQAALDTLSHPPALPKPTILTATVCREHTMDLYALCPCGSGKKLKFCHYNQPADLAWLSPVRPALGQPRSLAAA